jgi:hypothetical protein
MRDLQLCRSVLLLVVLVTSVLRFEQDVNPAKTKLLGWEGRFEPLLVGSKKVVLEPLHDLGNDERVPLLVTLNDEPWRFLDARLSADFTSYTTRPFALRMDRAEIVPGQSGKIAVVADESAFASKGGLVDLALEIFRQDGLQQVVVGMDHTLILR